MFVGEPVRLEVTWSVTEPLDVLTEDENVTILLARDGAFLPWIETSNGIPQVVEFPRRLVPGAPFRTAYIVSASGVMTAPGRRNLQLAFPVPGTYRIKVRHRSATHPVTSNVASITVSSPTGPDLELLNQHIRPNPEIMTPWLLLADPAVFPQLMARYGSSRYLSRPKLIWFGDQLVEAIAAAPEPAHPNDPIGGEVPALLDRLATEDFGESPFEEDRLLLLADMTERSNRPAQALPVWQEILARFPNGVAARRARSRVRVTSGS